MRALMHLPGIDLQNLNELRELVTQIVDMLNGYDVRADEHAQIVFQDDGVGQGFQEKLARLNLLTGKVNNPFALVEVLQKNTLDDVAMQLLQPKPPALPDLTPDEVAEIVSEIVKPEIKTYHAAYYIELLRNSLLLPEVKDYIEHPENWGMPSDASVKVIAQKMYEDGTESSRIIVR